MKYIKYSFIIFLLIYINSSFAQQSDSSVIKSIYDEALKSYNSYNELRYLCKNIGGRICGSKQSETAIEWAKKEMTDLGLFTGNKSKTLDSR